ncbi:hypothetical protein INS49_003203 [Diaporthe citri]|uniref:uncharacterized protein n=1 Tax=Diaporthe citri TaxID=83186 RepID=UPI001C82567E|nr:uncharacterized protein INS49_003203 [Diaporthe citri]KAG6368984.1 hypothetical protein INS49_003203 [Diaporthe citri]
MGAKEIRGLCSLFQSLHIDHDKNQLRLIVKLTRILRTTKINKIRQFKKLFDSEKVKDDDENVMLAEVDRSKETTSNDTSNCRDIVC